MRQKAALVVAVLASLWGCSNTLTGPVATTQPFNFADYFWPNADTSFRYVRDADGHTHVLSLKKDGPVIDKDINSGAADTLPLSRTADSINASGFTPSDCFALDQALEVVADSAPAKNFTPIKLKSIATGNIIFGGRSYYQTYGIDDTNLYVYSSDADELSVVVPLPASMQFKPARLFEDQGKSKLYLVDSGGTSIFSISPIKSSPSWSAFKPAPGPINCFAAGDSHDPFPFFIASGGQIYAFDPRVNQFNGNIPVLSPVVAMEKQSGFTGGGALLIGTIDGKVSALDPNDMRMSMIAQVPGSITSIAGAMIGTSSGLYAAGNGFSLPVATSAISALYAIPINSWTPTVFAGLSNDSVSSFANSHVDALGVPFGGVATQFSCDWKNRLYALVGNRVFSLRENGWETKAQSTSQKAQWTPGGLKLLCKDDEWLAGYVVSFASNNRRGYVYKAKLEITPSDIRRDGILYENVIAVRYTPSTNGTVDTVHAPEYVIYYQKGTGPIRIEKTEAGKTQITRIAFD